MSSDQDPPPPGTMTGQPGARFCTQCGAPLTPGVKFCHRCGYQVDQPTPANAAPKTLATTLPWAVAGVAFLALFAMLAGRGFNQSRGSALDAPMTALPNPMLDGGPMGAMMGAAGGATGGPAGAVRAPDISNMDPAELADRLQNRVMLLYSQGKMDSVQFFASMAIQAYQMLADAQGHPWNTIQRYEVGRVAAVAGALPLAKAQADTILQQQSDHLLGLLLAANVAKLSGNTPAYEEYASHFSRVRTSELAQKRPEYDRYAADLETGP